MSRIGLAGYTPGAEAPCAAAHASTAANAKVEADFEDFFIRHSWNVRSRRSIAEPVRAPSRSSIAVHTALGSRVLRLSKTSLYTRLPPTRARMARRAMALSTEMKFFNASDGLKLAY